MPARWLSISDKHRRHPGWHASLADFSAGDPEPVDPAIALRNDDLSLYCLDDANGEAIFVDLPAEVRLTDAPFIYMRQYEEARRLLAVPYADFTALAEALPAPDRFIMVYMTGRCGSTLLSHALNRVDGVVSLSEPDAPIGLVDIKRAGNRSRAEMQQLFDASIRFLYRRHRHPDRVFALKMRSESIHIADLIQATYPHAVNLFTYRDVLGFVGSMYRIFMRLQFPETISIRESRDDLTLTSGLDWDSLRPYFPAGAVEITQPEHLAIWWLGVIDAYLAAIDRGIVFTAVRFEDLTQLPAAIPRILEICRLENTGADRTQTPFLRDSQAGTVLQRERPEEAHFRLTPAQQAAVLAIVARHPTVNAFAGRLPGTLTID